MTVCFEFNGNLVDVIGRDMVSVSLGAMSATLGEALTQMFDSFPQIREKFEQTGILIGGEMKAMFVLENNLIQIDNVITDNCVIRVLPQICGG